MEHRYQSGEVIHVGDNVRIDQNATGVVVGIIDSGAYAEGHTKEAWAEYETGILVESASFGLILYQEVEDIADLAKIS